MHKHVLFPQFIIAILLAFLAYLSTPAFAQSLEPEDLYKKILPSVITLTVETDKDVVQGTGFLAIKDGIAVTAWHVMIGAKRATAKFASGEEYEVSGLIDKDEKRDICLIRVKVAGQPLLPLATEDPVVASKAYIIGAPMGLEFSISDGLISQVRTIDGMKQYQYTCASSHGNSGGPLLNEAGKVLGVVSWGVTDGQDLNFAIPINYVRGLDTTLPTQPFNQVTPSTPITNTEITPDETADKLLSEGFLVIGYWNTTSILMQEVVRTPLYKEGFLTAGQWTVPTVPPNVYTTTERAIEISKKLIGMKTTGFRENIRSVMLDHLEAIINSCEEYVLAIEEVQRQRDWAGEPNNHLSKSYSFIQMMKPFPKDDLAQLYKSEAFLKGIPLDAKIASGMQEDSCGFLLGTAVYWEDPLYLVSVLKEGFIQSLGLRTKDRIIAVDGKALIALQDLKTSINEHLGKTIEVQVQRGDKKVVIKMRIPKKIPKEALRMKAT